MGEYTGGYTSAVNDISRRDFEDAETARVRDALMEAMSLRVRQQKARESAVGEMGIPPPPGGPQPPMPGQASQPGIQAQGQGGPPGPPPAGMPPPPGPPGPQMMPASWRPSPVSQMRPQPPMGGLPGGGAPGASPAGGASPGMPAPQQMPPPPPKPSPEQIDEAGTKVMPAAGDWVKQTIASMQKKGKSAGEIADTLEVMKGWHDDSMKNQYQVAIIDLKAQEAATHAYKAESERLKAEAAAGKPEATTGFQKEVNRMQELEAQGKTNTTEYREIKKHVERIDSPTKVMMGGGGKGGGSYGTTEFDKLKPAQQETVKFYATMQIGGDSTWRTGLSRATGGANLIKAVDEYVPVMAGELGLDAADVGTNRATRVASQAALTQNTKDLATLKPYVDMLDQNVDILKGLATKVLKTNAALANKPLNALGKYVTGNPDLAEYMAQIEIVKNEATRVISNPRLVGQMTDTARQEIESIINGDMALGASIRVLDRLKNDGERRLTTMETQQKSLTGKIKGMMQPGGGKGDSGPKPGTVENGYRFKGGDPAKKENWEKV